MTTPDTPTMRSQLATLAQLIARRHSSRSGFDPQQPVPRAKLARVFEAARWAPSMGNMQNYHVLAVTSASILQQITALGTQMSEEFLKDNFDNVRFSEEDLRTRRTGVLASNYPSAWNDPEAWNPDCDIRTQYLPLHAVIAERLPLVFLAYDARLHAPGEEIDRSGWMGLGCVIENIWLTATAENIGVRMLSMLANEDLREPLFKILKLPSSFRIACGMQLGYEADLRQPEPRVRRPLANFVHENTFQTPYEIPVCSLDPFSGLYPGTESVPNAYHAWHPAGDSAD